MSYIENAAELLSRFPGIGKKTSLRLVYFLLKEPKRYSQQLGYALTNLRDNVFPCEQCGNYTDQNPCEICTNPRRNTSMLCVVALPQDVLALESSESYDGLYHVLGGLISPLDGIGPDELSIEKLKKRVATQNISEVILATSPTIEGESTARYVAQVCGNDICVFSRIALGIPMGSDLEYTDKHTIALSLNARTDLQ